jgi:hypothetical protein
MAKFPFKFSIFYSIVFYISFGIKLILIRIREPILKLFFYKNSNFPNFWKGGTLGQIPIFSVSNCLGVKMWVNMDEMDGWDIFSKFGQIAKQTVVLHFKFQNSMKWILERNLLAWIHFFKPWVPAIGGWFTLHTFSGASKKQVNIFENFGTFSY